MTLRHDPRRQEMQRGKAVRKTMKKEPIGHNETTLDNEDITELAKFFDLLAQFDFEDKKDD